MEVAEVDIYQLIIYPILDSIKGLSCQKRLSLE